MHKLRSDPLIFSSLIVCSLSLLFLSLVILFFFGHLAPQMPLLYSLPWGDNQLVPWQAIVTLPLLCLSLIAINITASLLLLPSEPLLARIIILGATLTTILIVVTGIEIILLTHL